LDARLRKISALLFFLQLSPSPKARAFGEPSKFDDLTKGTAKGVAVRSVGGLELAPVFKPVTTTPSTYIWSIAADASGTLYAATGAPARVYRITPDGQSTVIFEPQELQTQALVVAKDGAIYAATNPDGKVYRIEPRKGGDSKGIQGCKERRAGQARAQLRVEFLRIFRSCDEIYLGPAARRRRQPICGHRRQRRNLPGNAQSEHSVFFKRTKPTSECWRSTQR